jgi:hypothetical protein
MQTFIPHSDIDETARVLDTKRLGKQRVETVQIVRKLLDLTAKKGWANHPAVRMWRGYEAYLVKIYLRKIMNEWIRRGYKNDLCEKHWKEFIEHPKIKDEKPVVPNWITSEFCKSHQSNLIRKLPEHYGKLFPDVSDNLPYIWPV